MENVVDKDLERAQTQASRENSVSAADRVPVGEKIERRISTISSSSSGSTSTASTRPDLRTRDSAPGTVSSTLTRRRTQLEVHRTETHRLQHSLTVGESLGKTKSTKPLPEFGGGKPYPPDLPSQEEYVVEYDGKDDPLHPMNWPMRRNLVLAYTSLCSTFTSSIFSAATTEVARVHNVSIEVATLTTSLYIIGYAFGPIMWGPFSELSGRKLPLMIGMFGFGIFNVAVATSKDLQTLMIGRFFCGIFGSCPLAIVGACFADIWNNKQRGNAVTIFASTVFLGPLLAPFIGGFIVSSHLGWRWTAYLTAIMGFFADFLIVVFISETYPPVVLVSKAAELRRRTKNWGIHAKQEEIEVDFKELIQKNFSRPFRLLFTEPIILLITIYMSFIYGLLYCFLTAYPLVFAGVHGFRPGISGLPFLGMVGGLVIVGTYVFLLSGSYNRKLDANGGRPVPEWRLPPVILGGALFAVGLFWFGWSGYKKEVHWIVPTLSGLFTGFGILAIFIELLNYLIDAYLMFAASAIAGNAFLRSVTAAGFPLFTRQMFDRLGIQWASTLLGCLAVLMVPIPIAFYRYGAKLRQKSRFSPTMGDKPPVDDDSSSDEEAGVGIATTTPGNVAAPVSNGEEKKEK